MNETTHHRESIEQLAEEFAERYRRGERPTIDEYVAAHPELAAEIRDLFPTLAMIEELAPSDASEADAQARGTSIEVKPLDRIGDFRILREIGRGGMGVVYEAEQESLGRRVALKVLPLHSASDPTMLARFRRESRAAGQLHHTNIVPVFEVGEYGGLAWYAMQFIPGQSLDEVVRELQRLRAGKSPEPVQPSPLTQSLIEASPVHGPDVNTTDAYRPIAPETGCAVADPTPAPQSSRGDNEHVELDFRLCCRNVSRMGLQVADAMAFAHARGVIHRDIKPSNLLLDTAGIVWVSDFGLAKTQDHALTGTGDIVGTVRYMAPERFRGECDGRSDIYSLGVTMYELLTLKPAFDHTDRLKLIESIGSRDPIKPRAIEPEVPRDVETIVLKAIEKDPRQRYQSAAAMAADLRRYLNDEPIQARRVGATERGWRWVRKNPVVTGLAAAIVLVTAIGFAATYAQMRAVREQRDDLRGTLYASQMNLVQSAYEADNVARALDILDQQRPKEGEPDLRGFEWHYWRRQCQGDAKSILIRELAEAILGGANRILFSPDAKLVLAESAKLVSTPDGRPDRMLQVWNAVTGQLQFEVPASAILVDGLSQNGLALSNDTVVTAYVSELVPQKTQVIVRDALTGRKRLTFDVNGAVGPLSFTVDGRSFAGVRQFGGPGTSSESLQIWETGTGKLIAAIDIGLHGGRLLSLRPDGARAAIIFAERSVRGQEFDPTSSLGVLGIWDIAAGKELVTLAEPITTRVVAKYSPDGRWLCTASPDGSDIVIWNAETGQHHRRIQVRSANSEENLQVRTHLAFSPDGSHLVVAGSWGTTLTIWNLATGKLVGKLQGHTREIEAVTFSSDGSTLYSAGRDRVIRIWAPRVHDTLASSKKARFLAVSRNGQFTAALGDDDTKGNVFPLMLIRDGHSGKVVQKLETGPSSAGERNAMVTYGEGDRPTFGANSQYLVLPAEDGDNHQTVLRIFSIANGRADRTIPLGTEVADPIELVMSDDGRRLAAEWPIFSAQSKLTTRHVIWNFQTGQVLFNVTVERNKFRGVALSPDGALFAAPISLDGNIVVRLWNTDSGHVLRDIPVELPVTALAFGISGRGVLVMTGGRDGSTPSTGTAYDTTTGEVLSSVRGVFGRATAIAFSPDGKRLAIASAIEETQTGEIKIWDMESQRELMTLKTPEMHPRSLHFTPDGYKLVFLGSRTGPLIWDGTPLVE